MVIECLQDPEGNMANQTIQEELRAVKVEQDIADLTEPDDRMQELWKLIKENVRDNISQVSFEIWIEPCCPVSITDNRIVLNDDAKLADFRKVFGDKMEDLTV